MVLSVSDCWNMAILPLPLENKRSLALVRSLEDFQSLCRPREPPARSCWQHRSDVLPLVFEESDDTTVPKSSRRLHSAVRPRDGDDEALWLIDMEALETRTSLWYVHA
jgi:hypothetical protein